MNILMIIESLRTGGKERQAVELLKALTSHSNLNIQLVVLSEGVDFPSVLSLNIKIHFLKKERHKGSNIVMAIYKICRQFKPDILHTWGILATLYSLLAAKLLRVKIVNGSVRFAVPFKKLSKKWIYAKTSFFFSNFVVANSLSGLKAQGLNNSQKHFVIHNGFDPARLHILAPQDDIKMKFFIKTKFVVGMVGSFNDAKDYRTYIKSARHVLEIRKDVTFLCVGDGPGLEEIKSSVPPGCRDFIKFLGRQEKVEAIINIFDIGMLTCNTDSHAEGCSNSIMEYMALGKPVIATESGGNNELIDDQKTGFIIRPFDPDELTEKISLLLNNSSLRKDIGKAGRKKIKNKFNSQKMTKAYLDLYKKLLA